MHEWETHIKGDTRIEFFKKYYVVIKFEFAQKRRCLRNPALGGSTIATILSDASILAFLIKDVIISSALPATNVQFSILFFSALYFASSTACDTISTPSICLQYCKDINIKAIIANCRYFLPLQNKDQLFQYHNKYPEVWYYYLAWLTLLPFDIRLQLPRNLFGKMLRDLYGILNPEYDQLCE